MTLPIDFRPVALTWGVSLSILALFMIPPMVADLLTGNDDWLVFLFSAIITAFAGIALILTNYQKQQRSISTRQGFMLTTSVWLIVALFASLPLALSARELTYADSFFEAMSGITTTGATVVTGLETLPPGILLWRAILQWLGGIGIIVMGIAILPMLNIGGMQLFRTESSDKSEKILPRAAQIASNTGAVYLALTFMCALSYRVAGMNGFEAIAHSMTTISTGGLSTRDSSIGGFNEAGIEWTAIVFMILGGMPFVLFIQMLRGIHKPLFSDIQVRWYLAILGVGAMALATEHLLIGEPFQTTHDIVRHSVFASVTIMTGTGYSADDYMRWGPLAIAMLFFYACIGGCTGSTAGGIKIFRFVVLYQVSRVQVSRLIQPSGVFRALYNGEPLAEATSTAVLAFIFLFGLTFSAVALLLSLIGLDFITAMSASIAAVANVGPGLGPIIGPAGHYGELPEAAKWVLAFAMLLGRLELFTVLVLFAPAFWRH